MKKTILVSAGLAALGIAGATAVIVSLPAGAAPTQGARPTSAPVPASVRSSVPTPATAGATATVRHAIPTSTSSAAPPDAIPTVAPTHT